MKNKPEGTKMTPMNTKQRDMFDLISDSVEPFIPTEDQKKLAHVVWVKSGGAIRRRSAPGGQYTYWRKD